MIVNAESNMIMKCFHSLGELARYVIQTSVDNPF
jgi:hypothetical protein